MPITSSWFSKLGFEVLNCPGVSRAWQYDLADGSFVLITDLGGYDLPEPGGPYSAMVLSSANDLGEVCANLATPRSLFQWFARVRRKYAIHK